MPVFSFDQPIFQPLVALHPVSALLHVGHASQLQPDGYKALQTNQVLWVHWTGHAADDAPSTQVTQIGKLSLFHMNQVVSEHANQVTFNTASLKRESGLVHPSHLTELWQNLQATMSETVEATTIEKIVDDAATKKLVNQPNWLFVDCFPAARLLRGANKHLKQFDVVVGRSLAGELPRRDLEDSSSSSLNDVLKANGYRECLTVPGTHPKLAYSVFVRDWKSECHAAVEHQTRQEQVLSDISADRDRLSTAISAMEGVHQQRLQAASRDHEMALERVQADAESRIDQLRDEHRQEVDRIAAKTVDQIESALKAHQVSLDDLAAEHHSTLEQLQEEIRTLSEANVQLTQRIALLDADLTELEHQNEQRAQAEKKLLIAENNLRNLQDKYANLVEAYDCQTARLEEIRVQLEAALRYMPELDTSVNATIETAG